MSWGWTICITISWSISASSSSSFASLSSKLVQNRSIHIEQLPSCKTAITGKCREKVIAQHKTNYCISSKQNCSSNSSFIHSCTLCMLKKLQFFTHSFKRWQLSCSKLLAVVAEDLKGHWNLLNLCIHDCLRKKNQSIANDRQITSTPCVIIITATEDVFL